MLLLVLVVVRWCFGRCGRWPGILAGGIGRVRRRCCTEVVGGGVGVVSVENGAVIVLVLLEVVVVLMVEVLVLGSTHFTPFDLHLSAFLTKMEIKAIFM